nr:RNA-directed DNA polymerase, eukaryota [Tanacetum cinerariifolium]
MSKVKDFGSLANLKVMLGNEGFNNIKLSYMGGYWVMVSFPSVETMKNFQSNVGVESWFSQIQTVSHDFVIDGRVTWVEIEGLPFKMWTENTFRRVASKWGSLLDMDEKEDVCYHSKRIFINTNVASNIFESFKVNYKGRTIWVRAKEVPGWVPDFVEENDVDSDTDKESEDELPDVGVSKPVEEAEEDSDEKMVPDTKFDEIPTNQFDEEVSVGKNKSQSDDPFNIYEILNKKRADNSKKPNSNVSLQYPPGFTSSVDKANNGEQLQDGNENTDEKYAQKDERTGEKHTNLNQKSDIEESVCSGHFKKSKFPQSGRSVLLLIEDLVKVGQAMGYNMEGLAQKAKKDWVKELCITNKVNFLTLQETKMESIDLFCIKRCWGNLAFDYDVSASVGNSGGILCVWDPKMFKKLNSTVSDYFVIIRGDWVPNGNKLLIISVYAPQELAEKRMFWDYLSHVISRWVGEVVIMGDFNEVRDKSERYGSVFNKQGADVFNAFISNAGLTE